MAFKIFSTDDGRVPAIEYLPAGTVTPMVGMALIQTEGKLSVASGETDPTYICMTERETACADGEIIPVIRVQRDIIFETKCQESIAAIKPGDKLTLHTDGMQVTATKEKGVAEVISCDGTEAGSAVRVRFSGPAASEAV